jgi:hypothetical protein
MRFEGARGRRSVRVKTETPTWRILAVLTYEMDLDELLGRDMAVTGVPAHAAVQDWPVTWTDGMRVLDGPGQTVLVPGEGVLIGLSPGLPEWWIDGDRVSRAFQGRGSITVTDRDRLVGAPNARSPIAGADSDRVPQRADKSLTRRDSRSIPPEP